MSKKPTREQIRMMCTRKRRYKNEGDALDAARILGLERFRKAYRCENCHFWHLSSVSNE